MDRLLEPGRYRPLPARLVSPPRHKKSNFLAEDGNSARGARVNSRGFGRLPTQESLPFETDGFEGIGSQVPARGGLQRGEKTTSRRGCRQRRSQAPSGGPEGGRVDCAMTKAGGGSEGPGGLRVDWVRNLPHTKPTQAAPCFPSNWTASHWPCQPARRPLGPTIANADFPGQSVGNTPHRENAGEAESDRAGLGGRPRRPPAERFTVRSRPPYNRPLRLGALGEARPSTHQWSGVSTCSTSS